MKNYYHTLGLDRNVSLPELKAAYRKLATKFHPDKNDGDPFFETRFKEILEAYEVLSDEKKRTHYNEQYDWFYGGRFQEKNPPFESKTEEKEETTAPHNSYTAEPAENTEKEKPYNPKATMPLPFEDKAWIFVGNWFPIPMLVGLYMFVQYRAKGYTKKSNQVCTLSLWSLLGYILLFIMTVIANETGRY